MAEQKRTTIRDLLSDPSQVKIRAESSGHEAYFPVPVQVEGKDGKTEIRGQIDPALGVEEALRGRIYIFTPTGERVTIIRPRVGKSYKGDWIHEVITREGHSFLSTQKQLKNL